ncbi:hypothetical protein WJX72_000185 [[Myrmecia] bisecta]|uniref:C2 NT-type domain-containing protein n=1 Tax=[Myrmecia] bisecta TaxID=41462 RepID=A0AAW1P4F1_9CHLO
MGLFGKSKSKQARFDFYIHIHSLTPWPARFSALLVHWERGSSRQGYTKAAGATTEPGRSVGTYSFEETFHVPCTLYQDSSKRSSGNAGGPFEKKWLILAVLEADGKPKGKEPLGRVVINLADYAAMDAQAQMAFTVACNKAISSAVGEAKMLITVGCRSKTASAGRGPMVIAGMAVSPSGRSTASEDAEGDDDEADYDEMGRETPRQPAMAAIPESPARASPSGRRFETPPGKAGPAEEDEETQEEEGDRGDEDGAASERLEHSDPDSDDDFLAQAVAAMETGKRASPPKAARGLSQQQPDAERPNLAAGAVERSLGSLTGFGTPTHRRGRSRAASQESIFLDEDETEVDPIANSFLSTERVSKRAAPRKLHGEVDQPPAGPSQIQPTGASPTKAANNPTRSPAKQEAAAAAVVGAGAGAAAGRGLGARKLQPEAASQPLPPPQASSPAATAVVAASAAVAGAGAGVLAGRGLGARKQQQQQQQAEPAAAANGNAGAGRTDAWLAQGDVARIASGAEAGPAHPPDDFVDAEANAERSSLDGSHGGERREAGRWSTTSNGSSDLDPGLARNASLSGVSRSSSRRLMKPETQTAVTASRKWMRRMNSGKERNIDRVARQPSSVAAVGAVGAAAVGAAAVGAALVAPSGPSASSSRSEDHSHAGPGAPQAASGSLDEHRELSPRASLHDIAVGPSADDEGYRPALVAPPTAGLLALPNGMSLTQAEAMAVELRTIAALEASVYLARAGKGRARRVKVKSVHAPARRLARTTISLGPEEGIMFGLRAIRAVEAEADSCSDIVGMAYWWSNCIQLRWMLWAMCHGGALGGDTESNGDSNGGLGEFDWVMDVLVPPLRELEGYIFEQMFRHLWTSVLLEHANSEGLPGSQQPVMVHGHKVSSQELAIQRWFESLQAVHRCLVPAQQSATSGHVHLLKQKVIKAILRRLDSTLFDALVAGDELDGSPIRRDVFSSGWKQQASHNAFASNSSPALMPLDARLLPFPTGPLSFGVGVNLKMAVTRWTNWATDVGIKEERRSGEEGYALFPKLRATADLLMMPKEVLTDSSIRAEVVPGLSLRRICQLLVRFEPDDFAADPLPPGLLDTLHAETPPSEPSPSPTGKLEAGYEPPTEASLLAEGLIEPVSLEMDDESDDELDALAEMYDHDHKGEGTQRYVLLRELWNSAR